MWERTARRPSTSSGPAPPRLTGTRRWFARSGIVSWPKIEKAFERGIIGAPPVIGKAISVQVSIDDVAGVAAKRESRNGSHHVLPRGLARDHQPGHHVDALHRLRRIPGCIGEIHAAVNSARRLRVTAGGIKPRERVHVVHRRDARSRDSRCVIGTQLIGSAKCITGNPAKSALVGSGFRVNTFTLACDHPKPTVRPSTRTKRY